MLATETSGQLTLEGHVARANPIWRAVSPGHHRGPIVAARAGRGADDYTERPCSEPWAVSDAPADDIAALVKTIIGIRIEVSRLEGAWEMIPHHAEENRLGVISGRLNSIAPNDHAMAAAMRNRETSI